LPSKPVLHIAPTPFFADRGCHIRIRNELEALSKEGIDTVLCTYHHGRDMSGIDTRRIPPIPGYTKLDAGFSPYRFLADFFLFFLVLGTAWKEKPRILHAHLHEGALIGRLVSLCLFWRRMVLVMDMQGSLSGELVGYGTLKKRGGVAKIIGWIEYWIYRMPALIVCSSKQSQQTVLQEFGIAEKKTLLVQDVVPEFFFRLPDPESWKRQHAIPLEKKIILYTGSLLPGKGVGFVMQVIEELGSQRDDLYFVLVGYPVEEAAEFITKRQLQDSVLLTGQVAYDQLPHWLAIGDIALEPKEDDAGEASGKLLHYMAAGLDVVCFDTLNNRRMLQGDGCYAQVEDPGSFVRAVETALKQDAAKEERRERMQQTVRQSYSTAAVGSLLRLQYGRLLE
jgi:glycosyltransferase involved in cell wall biosynthesis